MTFLAALLGASLGALSPSPASVPVSEGFVTVEPGVRLYYRKIGDGKNVLVSPMGSWLAEPLAPLARADRTLILYDTRGRGRSNRVDVSKVSFANEISDLDAVRRHFGLETMMLAGWSHYGMMTAVYAIRNPARVTRLLQITPGAPRSDPYLQEGMAAMQSRTDGARYEAVQAKRRAGGFEKDPAGLCRGLREATRAALFTNPADAVKMTFDGCTLETEWPDNQDPWWNALFSSMMPWDYRKEAQALPMPRLVIHGEKDFIPLGGSREWAAGNPNARLLVMKGVGHHPFVEAPAAFFAAVEPFLDGKWPAGAEAVPAAEAPQSVAALVREARAAYDRGDRETFRQHYEEIARRRPGDVYVLYNLACGQALTGRSEAAQATLGEIARRHVWVDLAADEDFAPIRATEGYRKAAASLAAVRTERVSGGATRAFTIPEKGLVPEGVAYDPVSASFFVSSIRKRKIFRVDPNGRISEFVSPARDGLRSAAGMGVDPKRRTLWVASQALPSMDRYVKGQAVSSAVFEYDLDTGRLRKEHRAPEKGAAAAFDDLTVAPDGRVFVNDGRNPRVWTIAPGGALEVFVEDDDVEMGGTQGLAISPDGKTLYASDYRGLFAIDVTTRRVLRLTAPDDLALNGIDGLVYASGGLVAIQNGIQPHRVLGLDLTPDGLGILRGRILEMNHPEFDEPTLGTVVEDALYFTADSQGQKFLDEKKPMPAGEMRDAVILRLPLR